MVGHIGNLIHQVEEVGGSAVQGHAQLCSEFKASPLFLLIHVFIDCTHMHVHTHRQAHTLTCSLLIHELGHCVTEEWVQS